MNTFDKNQKQLIRPLYQNKVILHFPFFANTFPLVFHYYSLLKDKSPQDLHKLIEIHDWKDRIPPSIKYSTADMHIFYAGNTSIKTIKDGYHNGPFKVSSFVSNEYSPSFIFLKYSLWAKRLFEKNSNGKYDFNENNIAEAKEVIPLVNRDIIRQFVNTYKGIEIYTDTPNEAETLKKYLFKKSKEQDKVTVLEEYALDPLKVIDPKVNILDVHFYSAPITMFLFSKKGDYIPFRLPRINKLLKDLKTYVVILAPKKLLSEVNLIKTSLEEYHENLYIEAKKNPYSFKEICLSYNKYAQLIKHSSFFSNAEAFSNCLSLHHDYGEDPAGDKGKGSSIFQEDNSGTIRTDNARRRLHIHFGAGMLGIGLVLPILKSKGDRHVNILVIQKKRGKWLQMDYTKKITLCNDKGYALDFPVLTDKETHKSIIEKWKDGDVLFLTEKSYYSLLDIMEQANSISISFGENEPQDEIANTICMKEFIGHKRPFFFAFENNPIDAIEGLKDCNKIRYIPLKADKICSYRLFNYRANIVNVICEEYCQVVFHNATLALKRIFSKKFEKCLVFIRSDPMFDFYSKRKKYLLNQLHFVIAANGYSFLQSKSILKWENQYIPIIQSALESDSEYKTTIDVYIRTQIVRLLLELERDHRDQGGLNAIFKGEDIDATYDKLLKYSDNVRKRFSNSGEDELKRIFDLDDPVKVVDKFNSNVKGLKDFVDEYREDFVNIKIQQKPQIQEIHEGVSDLSEKIRRIFAWKIESINTKEDETKEKAEQQLNQFEKARKSLEDLL